MSIIKNWTCNMSIEEILEINFKNNIGNKISYGFDYSKEEYVLDLILLDLPVGNINIIKYRDNMYIDNYKFICFFREYLYNSIRINNNFEYINEIIDKKFKELDEKDRSKIMDYLFTCNIIEVLDDNDKIAEKIIEEYNRICS